MAERAHPDDPAFQDRWIWRRGRWFIAWPTRQLSPWKKALEFRYQFCQKYVGGKRVLDVPCGVGWGTSMLRRTKRLVGVDSSEEAVREARKRYGRRAEFLVGDMAQLQFPDRSFDVVTCMEGIEHVPQDVGSRFVVECARLLSDSGVLIMTSPIPDPRRAPNPYHVHEYERDEFLALVAPGFRTKVAEVMNIGGIEVLYYVGEVCRGGTE